MAHTIELIDGSIHTINSERDILDLVDEHMGFYARTELEDMFSEHDLDADYIEELEDDLKGVREHHKEVMKELRKLAETIAGLIREKDIDRKKLSTVAGEIGSIIWGEGR